MQIINHRVSLPVIFGIFFLFFLLLPLAAQSINRLRLERSADLQTWHSIAVTSEMIDAEGRIIVYTDDTQKQFRIQLETVNQLPPNSSPASSTSILNRLRLEESDDLKVWQSVSVTPAMIDTNGRLVLPASTAKRFYRMQVAVIQQPGISFQPASTTINSGSTTTLTVTTTGTAPLTYQWYQAALGTTTTPVGTNSASFTTPALTATTTYWVRITNGAGSVDSGLATVTVVTAPSITTEPASRANAFNLLKNQQKTCTL